MTTPTAPTEDALLAVVRRGVDVVDLSQPFTEGMPCSANHPGFRMTLARRHGDRMRPGGGSAASEIIITGGHVGTHVDALAHVSQDGLLHGGVDAQRAQAGGRFSVHGAEAIPPMVCPGTLLDVASLHGVECLPAGYGITAGDLSATAQSSGSYPEPGGVCLVNTGWSRHWHDRDAYLGVASGVPGVTEEAAEWLAERRLTAVGADTTAFELIPPERGHAVLPVHGVLLVEHGIHIIEHLRLTDLVRRRIGSFTFVLAPLPIVGGTGSPVRPLAVIAGGGR